MEPDRYEWARSEMNQSFASSLGYTAVLPSSRHEITDDSFDDFVSRFEIIKEFQETIIELYKKAVVGKKQQLLKILEGNLPAELARIQRRIVINERIDLRPKFFRTDEAKAGKIIEVQCPGSMWGEYALLERYFQHYAKKPEAERFSNSMPERFGQALRTINADPVIHHLVDNASIPHSMRYFIELTRLSSGLRYWGYDDGIKIRDCNFIRSHSYFGLISENLFTRRIRSAVRGKVDFDYPPISIFDQKVIMALPFHQEYGEYFSDEVREIFPRTSIILEDKIQIEKGDWVTFSDFINRSQSNRDFYIKYAGLDTSRNWGSMAVIHTRKQSKPQLNALFSKIARDFRAKQFWVLQSSISETSDLEHFTHAGVVEKVAGHLKHSGFYGPTGLLGLALMHRAFHKVHGAHDTMITIV